MLKCNIHYKFARQIIALNLKYLLVVYVDQRWLANWSWNFEMKSYVTGLTYEIINSRRVDFTFKDLFLINGTHQYLILLLYIYYIRHYHSSFYLWQLLKKSLKTFIHLKLFFCYNKVSKFRTGYTYFAHADIERSSSFQCLFWSKF